MPALLPPLPMPQASQRTIVVIEPSLSLRTQMEQTLGLHGYSGVSFATPQPALLALRQGKIPGPTLLLLSEPSPAVPFLDGLDVLLLLQEWDLDMRTVLLMDEASVLTAIKAQIAGACATLPKPFRIQALLHLVQVYGRA